MQTRHYLATLREQVSEYCCPSLCQSSYGFKQILTVFLQCFYKITLNSSTILDFLNTVAIEMKCAGVLIFITWYKLIEEAWNQTEWEEIFPTSMYRVDGLRTIFITASRSVKTPGVICIWSFKALKLRFHVQEVRCTIKRLFHSSCIYRVEIYILRTKWLKLYGDFPFYFKVRTCNKEFHRRYWFVVKIYYFRRKHQPRGCFSFLQLIFASSPLC